MRTKSINSSTLPQLAPYAVDFLLTGRCNLSCPFCFFPKDISGSMGTAMARSLFEVLRGFGAHAVVLSGGEPTLVDELPEIARTAKEYGLQVALSSNGCFDEFLLDQLAPSLDCLGLPLDSCKAATCKILRRPEVSHFEAVIANLERLRLRHPTVRVKLGTVVTTCNQSELLMLADSVPSEWLPDVWKFYEILSVKGNGGESVALGLNPDTFDSAVQPALRRLSEYGVSAQVWRASEAPGKHLFVDPSGTCRVLCGRSFFVLGNLIESANEVMLRVSKYVDRERLSKNFLSTYTTRRYRLRTT